MQEESKEARKRPKKGFPKMAIFLSVIMTVVLMGAGLGFLTASVHTMPTLKDDIRPAASSQIFDVNGKLITNIHSVENRLPVTLNKIPKNLQNAFIAAEDVRFYQHWGIDPRGILRAVWSNVSDRGISEGGSTITQQLAKNTLLTQEQTLKRKIQEAFLALQIERQYSKNEILEMYLNQIYFGQGAYGVQSASQTYFGKNVEDLTLAEASIIAGIPKSPNYYSPSSNLKAAKERQEVVLDQMVKYGFIDVSAAASAKSAELQIVSKANASEVAPYFIDYVTQQLIEKYGADAVYKEGLKIYTTLDLNMQQAAEKALTKLPTYRTVNGIRQPQGALVALDPHNGYIKAMVGGRGGDQFNRAVLAERQPGSAFKPFVYLAALESGLTPSTIVEDSPLTVGGYSPVNYDRRFRGPVTLRYALENSLNIVAVKLAQKLGPEKPIYYAQQLGISTMVLQGNANDRNLSVVLGGLTRGVTPLEITSAYGVLANQGIRVEPVSIIKVVDRNGKVLEQNTPKEKVVVNERNAYLLTDMMRGVITRGTGGGANIGRPAAGKTGTTDNSKDAWFVGFTPDLVAGVWMGNDNEGNLAGITGGDLPATMWHDFMLQACDKLPVRDFIRPSGIVSVRISPKDGLLVTDPNSKDAHTELFVEGTQPAKVSVPSPDKDPLDPNNKDVKDNKDTKNPTDVKTPDTNDPAKNTKPPAGNTALPPPAKTDSKPDAVKKP